jgi:hypothetical protein
LWSCSRLAEAAALDLPAVKRRKISEREEAEAVEKARLHRDELLADLQAREAARRQVVTPEAPAAPEAEATPEKPAEPPAESREKPDAPEESATS